MGIVVQKYGGSSVADVERIGQVADAVTAAKHEGHDVVVVVSAMGKTTDELLSLAYQVDDSPPRRELDMLLTTGERVTMALLSMAIQKRGLDAISFTGSQSGIITNDRHFDAKIIEVRPHRIEDELHRGRIVIVAGYQGMSYKREITTLGRGGSDTSALALAAALDAERAEIYSDVDGVYSADPRVVPAARHLPELRYEEMQEMAEAGAKVLHAQAVELARRAGIAIHARRSFEARDGSARQTVVHDGAERAGGARAVIGQRRLSRVRVRGEDRRLRRALEMAQRDGVVAREITGDAGGGEFLVLLDRTPDWPAARERLREELTDGVTVDEELAAVSVVGEGVPQDDGKALGALSTLDEAGVSAHRVVTSPLRVTAVVDEAACDRAVAALHERLVECASFAIPRP